jgi:small subunit ribosomal protein S8
MTDPVGDFIIRIKNSLLAGHDKVVVPYSKLKSAIADILIDEGYLKGVKESEVDGHPQLEIELKYQGRVPAISGVKRLSKPGRRLYASAGELPKTLGGYGITIISTNQGLLTDSLARKQNTGGELICQVW